MKRLAFISTAAAALILVGAGCSTTTAPAPVAKAPAPVAAAPAPAAVVPVAPTPTPAPAAVIAPAPVPTPTAKTNGTAFKVGDKILGEYHNGSRWYVGKISGIDGPAISVAYNDGSKETLGPLNVSHFPTGAAKVVVGSKVAAKWSSGNFYGGKVTAVSGSKATVAWTDGSAPLDVALTDMVIQGK